MKCDSLARNPRKSEFALPGIGRADTGWRVAALAQLVEHLIRNEGVGGSNPSSGTRNLSLALLSGEKIPKIKRSGALCLQCTLSKCAIVEFLKVVVETQEVDLAMLTNCTRNSDLIGHDQRLARGDCNAGINF